MKIFSRKKSSSISQSKSRSSEKEASRLRKVDHATNSPSFSSRLSTEQSSFDSLEEQKLDTSNHTYTPTFSTRELNPFRPTSTPEFPTRSYSFNSTSTCTPELPIRRTNSCAITDIVYSEISDVSSSNFTEGSLREELLKGFKALADAANLVANKHFNLGLTPSQAGIAGATKAINLVPVVGPLVSGGTEASARYGFRKYDESKIKNWQYVPEEQLQELADAISEYVIQNPDEKKLGDPRKKVSERAEHIIARITTCMIPIRKKLREELKSRNKRADVSYAGIKYNYSKNILKVFEDKLKLPNRSIREYLPTQEKYSSKKELCRDDCMTKDESSDRVDLLKQRVIQVSFRQKLLFKDSSQQFSGSNFLKYKEYINKMKQYEHTSMTEQQLKKYECMVDEWEKQLDIYEKQNSQVQIELMSNKSQPMRLREYLTQGLTQDQQLNLRRGSIGSQVAMGSARHFSFFKPTTDPRFVNPSENRQEADLQEHGIINHCL